MMNRYLRKLASWLFMGVALSACTDYDDMQLQHGNGKPMELTGSIEQVYQTRASDFGFANGDCMGVYIVDYDKDVAGTLAPSGNRASNYAMTYDEASGKWSGNAVIYWKDETTPVDVYGYYPYESGISSIDDYEFTVSADQSKKLEGEMSEYEKSDFLWAKATKAKPADGAITLTYKHRLAGVKVNLAMGSGFTETEWQKLPRLVTVDNTLRNAAINLASGIATATGDFDNNIIMSPESSDAYRAVVVPQIVSAGKSVIGVTIDGVSYHLTKSADLTYNHGKLHHFTITVNKRDGGDYELKITSEDITPWENDESSHYLSLSPYVVVHVEKEGTLEQCLAEKGCELETLRNLKITGNLTDADFTFIREKLPYLYALNLRETRMKNVCSYWNWENDYREYSDDMLPENAFYGKGSLRTVILPAALTRIGANALRETQLTDILVIPNGVKRIDESAFAYIKEQNLEIVLPDSLEYIGGSAFYESNYKCEFKMPNTVTYIGDAAFSGSKGFYGNFRLPDNLEHLGAGWYHEQGVFAGMGTDMTGDIVIPKGITEVPNGAFNGIGFAKGTTITLHDGVTKIDVWAFGNLKLNTPISLPASLTVIQNNAFSCSRLPGTLTLPEKLAFLGGGAFGGGTGAWGEWNEATGITGDLIIPKNITVIKDGAFAGQSFFTVDVPDNVTTIENRAFNNLARLKTIKFGKNIDYIGEYALGDCISLQTFVCLTPTPPEVSENTFSGLYFDKVILEVPAQSVELYRNTPVWNQFRNITEHKELAFNVPSVSCMQNGITREGVVRSESEWEVIECPSWCKVSPMQGGQYGKEEVSITVDKMSLGSGTREGKVVFQLKGSTYTTYTDVKQYDSEYMEDTEIVLQEASVAGANPVPIFIVGEGFTAGQIADGTYLDQMRQQMEHFFNVEPYRTYRDYFKVSTAIAMSPDEGIIMAGTTATENKFDTRLDDYGVHVNMDKVMDYAGNITGTRDLSILMLGNMKGSYTTTFRDYWWENRRVSFCSMTDDSYPYDQRGLVQHEFGGHNFADLGDENVEHFEFLKACTCPGCNGIGRFNEAKNFGGFANLSLTGGINTVPWKHLIFDPRYSDIVDVYEGGHRHARGVYRSEIKTCMGTYIPYYSTIAREEIVRRIMKIAGLPFDFETFVSKDSREGRPTEE